MTTNNLNIAYFKKMGQLTSKRDAFKKKFNMGLLNEENLKILVAEMDTQIQKLDSEYEVRLQEVIVQ